MHATTQGAEQEASGGVRAATRPPRSPAFTPALVRPCLFGVVSLVYLAAWSGRLARAAGVWLRAALPVLIALGIICSTTDSPSNGRVVSALWEWMPWIALATGLCALLAWGLGVRRQVSVHEFVATGAANATAAGDADATAGAAAATGLSTLLVVELARLHDLQIAINDLSTTFREAGTPLPRLMTNDAPLLAPADMGDSTMKVGFITVPLRAVVALIEKLAHGPSLQGTVYVERDHVALVVQLSGNDASSWRVDARADGTTKGRRSTLCDLVEQVALQIHTDLYLNRGCNHEAAEAFVDGLDACRRAAHSTADRTRQLERAERAYLRAATTDQGFGLAFYNLGVVYSGQGRDDAAAEAFLAAIQRRPDDWRPYYALGLTYALSARELLKPTAGEYREAVCEAIAGVQDGASDAERLLGVHGHGDICRTADRERVRRACALLEQAGQLAERVVGNPVGGRETRRFQRIRGHYLRGVVSHYLAVAASGPADTARHAADAARAQGRAVRAGSRLLVRESRRKGTVAVWQREAATDILARLGEAHGQFAQSVDDRDARRLRRCMRASLGAAMRLEPHDAGLLRRDGDASLRLGRPEDVRHGLAQLATAVSLRPDKQDYRQRLAEAMRQAGCAGELLDVQVQAILERAGTRARTLRRLALTLALRGSEHAEEARAVLAIADRSDRRPAASLLLTARVEPAGGAAAAPPPRPATAYLAAQRAIEQVDALIAERTSASLAEAETLLCAHMAALDAAFPCMLVTDDPTPRFTSARQSDLAAQLATRLSRVRAACGDHREASEVADAMLAARPLLASVRHLRAELYLAEGDRSRARAALRTAELLDPHDIAVAQALARDLWQRAAASRTDQRRRRRLFAAEADLRRAAEAAGGDARRVAQLLVGMLDLELGRYGQAQNELATIGGRDELGGMASLWLADAMVIDGRGSDAQDHLELVLSLELERLGPHELPDATLHAKVARAIASCSLASIHADDPEGTARVRDAARQVEAVVDGPWANRCHARLATAQAQRVRSTGDFAGAVQKLKQASRLESTSLSHLRVARAQTECVTAGASREPVEQRLADARDELAEAGRLDLSGAHQGRIELARVALGEATTGVS